MDHYYSLTRSKYSNRSISLELYDCFIGCCSRVSWYFMLAVCKKYFYLLVLLNYFWKSLHYSGNIPDSFKLISYLLFLKLFRHILLVLTVWFRNWNSVELQYAKVVDLCFQNRNCNYRFRRLHVYMVPELKTVITKLDIGRTPAFLII